MSNKELLNAVMKLLEGLTPEDIGELFSLIQKKVARLSVYHYEETEIAL